MLYQLSYTPKVRFFCRIARFCARARRFRLTSLARAASFRPPPRAGAVGRKDGMRTYLSFETAVADIDARLDELRAVAEKGDLPALAEEIAKLEARADKALADLYASLTPWQKTQVARVQGRPRFGDYVKGLITEFTPLAGDRYFGEDEAIVGGLGRFEGDSVCVLGQEKGDDTASRVRHNFGMARPEGYRKAARLMELADRFGLPVISLVDTAGAFPGVEAEERGQAEAIARSTDACLALGAPNVAVIIGEGGSGGALAIAVCNTVLMLEHAIYTVASPEAARRRSCGAIPRAPRKRRPA